MKKLVLYGAGGMGKEAAILVKAINKNKNEYHLLGFIDDNSAILGQIVCYDLKVIGGSDWLIQNKDQVVCCCTIGNPKIRRKIMENLLEQGVRFESLVSPDVYIPPSVSLGEGCIIQAKSLVSVNIKFGKGVFLNTDVSVGHDVIIDNYTVCHPRVQISGGCCIGESCLIGAMSFLQIGTKIGNEAVVAPGSIVFRNVKPGKHVLGNPAKVFEL